MFVSDVFNYVWHVFFVSFCVLASPAFSQSVDAYDILGRELAQAYGMSPDVISDNGPSIKSADLTQDLKRVEIDVGEPVLKEVPVSRLDSYMVQFEPDASLGEVQDLLAQHDLQVADEPEKNERLSRIGTLIVERIEPDTESLIGEIGEAYSDPLIQRLRADPLVRSAVPDLVISTDKMPRPPVDQPDGLVLWDWRVLDACVLELVQPAPAGMRDGNWGLKATRFPAAWRLVSNRLAVEARDATVTTAVVDAGFEANDDLNFDLFPLVEHHPHRHGTHVAGIIGATFDNHFGIDGASPWARILAVPHARQQVNLVEGAIEEQVIALQSDIMATLIALLQEPELRVVNVSLGYNWKNFLHIDPGAQDFASIRNDISNTGAMVQSVLGLAARSGIVFVSAAGNDSSLDRPEAMDVEAQWASPLNWAALNTNDLFPVSNVIVVEAISRSGARAPFSNRGGHVSAPGIGILSTVGGGFAVDDGTSMAAPHVAALATLLIAYDPEITPKEIVRSIGAGARSRAGGAAPQIDALNALVAHDPDALRYLADLDFDGRVGPSDVELFKEQWRKLHALGTAETDVAGGEPVTIDAITGNTDGMRGEDLNGDGVVDLNEAAWPLIDLNGSGIATDNDCDRVEFGGQRVSDYEVLGIAWTDPNTPFDSIDPELCADCPEE